MLGNSNDSSFDHLFQELDLRENNNWNELNDQKPINSSSKLNKNLQKGLNTLPLELNSPKKTIYFSKQSAAIEYQRSNPHLIIFSQQITLSGCRKYLVTSLDHFLSFYFKMNEPFRHFYEVIVDGMCCKLYFDLEFNYLINTDINGDQIVHEFIIFVQQMLLKLYGLTIENEHFLWLDSSTTNKYSCHLIVDTGNVLFENNLEVGSFVKACEMEAKQQNFNQFFMISVTSHSNSNRNVFFADISVYSKNRNFRLYLSSKNGVNAVLKRSKYCTYKNQQNMNAHEIFLNSLIVVNLHNSKENIRILPKLNIEQSKTNESSKLINRIYNHKACEIVNQEYIIPDHTLMFINEKIIEYIISNLNKDDINRFSSIISKKPIKQEVFIRKISVFRTVILYDIINWKYCRHIGRSHKSNRIYFRVDLISKNVYQCCYDIECRTFQSDALFNVYEALSQNSYVIDETTCYTENQISNECLNNLLLNAITIESTILHPSDHSTNRNIQKVEELNDSLIIQVDIPTDSNLVEQSFPSFNNLDDSSILKAFDSISIINDLF